MSDEVTPLVLPTVTTVTPNTGPPAGGTAVTISGTNFTGATSVRFAGQPATSVVVVSATSITCVTPPAAQDGPTSVSVTTPGGTGASPPTAFTYSGATGTSDVFPAFIPIMPPPLVGNPPPPAFPPPSAVPVGPLVGPAIAAASVPPSVAGVAQPTYQTGSATAPTAASLFPAFTATSPSPPIVVSPQTTGVFGTFNNVALAAGQTPPWTIHLPPSTPTTAPITLDGFAPVWSEFAGAAAGEPVTVRLPEDEAAEEASGAGAVHSGNPGPVKRRRRSVLPPADTNSEH
jgi:hypothetical protein